MKKVANAATKNHENLSRFSCNSPRKYVDQSLRQIPVVYDVDILVIGGTTGGVAAAAQAAKLGSSVLLIANRTYLGDDICASYRFGLEPDELPVDSLAKIIYENPIVNSDLEHKDSVYQGITKTASEKRYVPTPMHVKRTLDKCLIDSGTKFIFGCFPTNVLYDENENICGIVMANRSGRQAITAKIIIDATYRALVARMSGIEFEKFPTNSQRFTRVVVGGMARSGDGIVSVTKVPAPTWNPKIEPIFRANGHPYDISKPENWDDMFLEYELNIDMPDDSVVSFARAEQRARDITFHPDQIDASEYIFQIPPDPMKVKTPITTWDNVKSLDLNAFCPYEQNNILILGGCAGVSREIAKKLLRPVNFIEFGTAIGKAAASRINLLKKTETTSIDNNHINFKTVKAKPDSSGDVKELLIGLRATQENVSKITSPLCSIPVIGKYDVVVVGGGTGGAPAAVSAAKAGAKTLVVEYQHSLGGMATVGLVPTYYCGNLNGFTAEIDKGVKSIGEKACLPNYHCEGRFLWNIEYKMEWYRRELAKEGGDIWLGSIGYGAFVENKTVKGVVIATPYGSGVILAKKVIDSTGSSDIAVAAGADYMFVDSSEIAMQGTGLAFRNLYTTGKERQSWLNNTDHTFVDDNDMLDIWRVHVGSREKFKNEYDIISITQTRERRRIIGDYVFSPLDIINNRTFEDSIVFTNCFFDTHGFTIHPIFDITPPPAKGVMMYAYIPYRCMLPKGFDGLLVMGLGISAHRDAMPVIRTEPTIQNTGYAAGIAAAMAAKENIPLRQIDIKKLQKLLVINGSLPQSVLTDKDSYPFSKNRIFEAVENLKNNYQDISIVMSQIEEALPILHNAYQKSTSKEIKLIYAHVLGAIGDPIGTDTLLEFVGSTPWDRGWNFTGLGQYGSCMSQLDRKIVALGRTGDKRALMLIIKKLNELNAQSDFSHHRAVAMALETLKDKSAAPALAQLLQKSGMSGYALTPERFNVTIGKYDTPRTESLREIILARALYMCGDHQNLGHQILMEYQRDLRGLYSRHASSILNKRPLTDCVG